MTIADMRQLLGLGDNVSDAAVAAAYAAFVSGETDGLQSPPVSLAQAKRHLRMPDDDNAADDQIAEYIADAMGWVERYTGHLLIARNVTERFIRFSRGDLRAWPIKPSALPVVTYSAAGVESVAVPDMRIDTSHARARLLPAFGMRWPVVPADAEVTVTVRAGYEAGDPIPGNLTRAMLVMISAFESDREGGEVFQRAEKSARSLCRDFRHRRL